MGFKILFVTHDMKSAEAMCEEICVIKNGRVVESAETAMVLSAPQAEYTRVLIASNFLNREFRV
jgi:peptide/nickel transport system ATP-binding protein